MSLPSSSDRRRLHVPGGALLAGAALLLGLATGAGAQNATPAGDHAGHGTHVEQPHVHPTPPAAADSVGLEERLGAKIPLDLTFHDEAGAPVTLRELVTVPTIIAPVYYRCPNVCSFLQGDLARVLPQLKPDAGREYRVLSVSFDETESPELARRAKAGYFSAMGGTFPTDGWRFLTGDAQAIRALTDALGYRFQRQGSDFLHPVAIAVVSTDGTIVRYLQGTRFLPKDVTLALYEAQAGRVGTSIRKVVQFCFSFDPERKTYVLNLLRISATVILGTLGLFLAYLLLTGKKRKKRP